MITFLLMLSSSDNEAKGSDGNDYVSPDVLHQTTGPREVMGMITSCLLMLSSSDNGPREVMGMITFLLLMLFSSDNGARGSDEDDYVSLDALHQTTGPREVMGMITSCLLMLSSSDNGAKGSDWNKKIRMLGKCTSSVSD